MKYWFTDPDADLSMPGGQTSLADKIKLVKDRMKVDTGAINVEDVFSIPDIWSIHRIYEMMLLYSVDANDEASKKYKEAVLRHWRAIIAIHVLGAKKYGLVMDSERIDGATINAMPKSNPSLAKTKAIMESLWDARPRTKISNSPDFDPDAVTVYYVVNKAGERLPYAMSSPTTFLTPTANAWDNLHAVCSGIKWLIPVKTVKKKDEKPDGDKKIKPHFSAADPVLVKGSLTLVERDALRNVLNSVADRLGMAKSEDPAAVKTLQELLKDYAKSLPTEPDEEDIFPEGGKLYCVPFKNRGSAVDASDPNIGGADPRCICSAFENGTYTNYLLSMPISEQAVDWLETDIAKYKITKTPNAGKIEFVIDYIWMTKPFQKIFSETNLVEIKQANMAITAIWPRCRMEHWDRYYVFRHEPRGSRVGDQTTYALVTESETCSEAENKAVNKAEFPLDGEEKVYYAQHSKYPSRWVLQSTNKLGERTNVGYFLSSALQISKQVKGRCYHAAIDFGTSATMIYAAVENQTAQPIESENLWSLPLFVPDGGRSAELLRYFIPGTNTHLSAMPLQSILAIEKNNKTPVFVGNWSYFQKEAEIRSGERLPDRFDVHSNLKWDSIHGLTFTSSYLRIISYFVALEARANGCTEMDAIISYPSAMTGWKDYVEKIDGELKNACEIAALELKNNGIRRQDEENADVQFEGSSRVTTESRAVAQRIRKQMNATQFCSIDIGGGTSDIFLFKNDGDRTNLKWDGYESSLLCGARSILLEGFVVDRGCLDALINLDRTDEVMDALKKAVPQMAGWAKDRDTEKIQRNIEMLLSVQFADSTESRYVAGERLCARAVSAEALSDPSVKRLRMRVAYKIAAIMYYAGMMTRETGTRVKELHIRFAGNGSKTLKWISNDDTITKRFLSAMFNAGAGIDDPKDEAAQKSTNIQFATNPKHEVACGAMMEPIKMSKHVDEILAGEKVKLVNKQKEACGKWTVNQNIALEVFLNSNCYLAGNEELKAFVTAFRRAVTGILYIPLHDNQFTPAIADVAGIMLNIDMAVKEMVNGKVPDKKSFFMIGVEVLGEEYLGIRGED